VAVECDAGHRVSAGYRVSDARRGWGCSKDGDWEKMECRWYTGSCSQPRRSYKWLLTDFVNGVTFSSPSAISFPGAL